MLDAATLPSLKLEKISLYNRLYFFICFSSQKKRVDSFLKVVRSAYVELVSVVCDESGHPEFPFSYLTHVTLLSLAQVRLSRCSVFAHPNYHFRQAVAQPADLSTLTEGAQNWSQNIKKGQNVSHYETSSPALRMLVLLLYLSAGDLCSLSLVLASPTNPPVFQP